jgi:hypothetical protein
MARTAIVQNRAVQTHNAVGTSLTARATGRTAANVQLSLIEGFLNRYNPGSYDVYYGDQVPSVSGQGRGHSGQELFAGHLGRVRGDADFQRLPHPCHECSLTFIAAGGTIPTVPNLFIGKMFLTETGFSSSATCSTGVPSSGMDPGSQGPSTTDLRHHTNGSPKGWPGTWGLNGGATVLDNGTGSAMPSGTWRLLLGADDGTLIVNAGYTPVTPIPPWRDQIVPWSSTNVWDETAPGHVSTNQTYRASSPTLQQLVFVRYNDNPAGVAAGAKPSVFANMGNFIITNSSGDSDPADDLIQVDPTPLYIGLAFLDSLSGGDLLGNDGVAHLAVQISGGFRRGGVFSPGGIAPHDTANFKFALDSLKTLNIPVSVGVNVDSIDAYASDLAMWQRAGSVRYTLESWDGVADSTKGAGAAAVGNSPAIVDPFGRFRTRNYFGPSTDTTSIYSLLRRGRLVLNQRFGSNRVDGILIAADDDYSPRGSTRWRNARWDSLAIAIDAAGFSGVAQNADDSLNVTTDASSPKGWTSHHSSSQQR